MADLQCLICEWTVEPGEMDEALALLGVPNASSSEALLVHMESHSLVDWIKAFKMADAYIAQLEAETQDQERQIDALKANYSSALSARSTPSLVGPPEFRPALINDDEPLAPNGQPLSRYLTPAEIERKRQQAEVRRQVEQADPDESLIPFIAPATRAEGVVGRKM